jgi:hypothetical protein
MKRKMNIIMFIAFSLLIAQTVLAQPKNDAIVWGVFEEGIENNLPLVNDYGKQFGKMPSTVMWYEHWRVGELDTFPLSTCQKVAAAGYMPHIVWEPWIGLDDILAGKYDNDIVKFAQGIAKFGKPIMIRFAHEFNGDWYPWTYINNAVVPATTWIKGYKYVHDKVVATGAKNALWMWSPNNGNGGKNPQDILDYYPGDEYVDWIALDGYNWGTSQSWSSWTSFDGVFNNVYQKVVAKCPTKPIMIGETGCSSTGGDKAEWITNMFFQLKNNFPHVKAFIWFNVNKETDWRFSATPESTNAYKIGLSDSIIKYDVKLLENLRNIQSK